MSRFFMKQHSRFTHRISAFSLSFCMYPVRNQLSPSTGDPTMRGNQVARSENCDNHVARLNCFRFTRSFLLTPHQSRSGWLHRISLIVENTPRLRSRFGTNIVEQKITTPRNITKVSVYCLLETYRQDKCHSFFVNSLRSGKAPPRLHV